MKRVSLALAALTLAGCNGGTVDRHALTKDAETLDSVACEGALVADGVARDRVTTFFAREQSEELTIQTSNLAHALATRDAAAGLETRVRAKAREAAALAAVFDRLHDNPDDRAVAAEIERSLKQAGDCP